MLTETSWQSRDRMLLRLVEHVEVPERRFDELVRLHFLETHQQQDLTNLRLDLNAIDFVLNSAFRSFLRAVDNVQQHQSVDLNCCIF